MARRKKSLKTQYSQIRRDDYDVPIYRDSTQSGIDRMARIWEEFVTVTCYGPDLR